MTDLSGLAIAGRIATPDDSDWDQARVAWNLAESGVHPLRLEELAVADEDRAALFGQELGYTQTNGTPELRAAIAAMYPGARPDHVEVTNGGSEANCIVLWHLVEPGDEMVMMMPNYLQMRGIGRALGAVVRPWPLVEVGIRRIGTAWRDLTRGRTRIAG